MKTMIMDTSSEYLIISLLDDNKVIYEYIVPGKNNHSDNLLKKIEEGLNQTGLEVKDFDKIVCGIGPGAYTGLRVALTVAKMFAWTLNKPLYTISSLDLMATKFIGKCDKVIAIDMKAKKDYVYHKIIKCSSDGYLVIEDETFIELNDASDHNSKQNIDVFISNDNICYDALNVEKVIKRVESIELLEPNYLREGM